MIKSYLKQLFHINAWTTGDVISDIQIILINSVFGFILGCFVSICTIDTTWYQLGFISSAILTVIAIMYTFIQFVKI